MLRTKKASKTNQQDPLYMIFEQHLFQFKDIDEDRKTFIDQVVNNYLSYLRKLNLAIPKAMEREFLEELSLMVSEMLTKKIYGCLSIEEFRRSLDNGFKRNTKKKPKLNKAG